MKRKRYIKSLLTRGKAHVKFDDAQDVGRHNIGAPVLVRDGMLFFLADNGDLCSMYCHLAKWFNWHESIFGELSDICTDYDDPFPVAIYYRKKEIMKNA